MPTTTITDRRVTGNSTAYSCAKNEYTIRNTVMDLERGITAFPHGFTECRTDVKVVPL